MVYRNGVTLIDADMQYYSISYSLREYTRIQCITYPLRVYYASQGRLLKTAVFENVIHWCFYLRFLSWCNIVPANARAGAVSREWLWTTVLLLYICILSYRTDGFGFCARIAHVNVAWKYRKAFLELHVLSRSGFSWGSDQDWEALYCSVSTPPRNVGHGSPTPFTVGPMIQ